MKTNARRRRTRFLLTLPERVVRGVSAALFGMVHETAELVLPRLVRRSRLYEVTAKNALRIAIELVGGVTAGGLPDEPSAGSLAVRKAAGNVVELGTIAAFGFSPLWLLAAASDVIRGSRAYLEALVVELELAGVVPPGARVESIDQLLESFERSSGRAASLLDIPPLELDELRASLAELRRDAGSLPSAAELAALYRGLRREASAEERTLLEVSAGIGLAFLLSARNVTRTHLVAPYRDDWQPLRHEGLGAYAARVGGPYRAAIAAHIDPERTTWTDRVIDRVSGKPSVPADLPPEDAEKPR